MAKPIVVLMPEKESAMLREGGALPASFFSPENEVCLWPHDIDYQNGLEIAKDIAKRPGDVPVFFGFPPSKKTAEIDERTAEIVSILGNTMVHIVFLDDKNDAGEIEYGHFGSFQSIIDWSRSLIEVLRTRFVNEVDLHRLESVLVVVCRGQQIQITEEECRSFQKLIGENPNDGKPEELRPFVSCYFLNRELSIDGGALDICASSVWDILVGRLLRAFVLSREQHALGANSERTLWMRPGIRIWKSEELYLDGAEEMIRSTAEHVLSKVNGALRDAVVEAEGGTVLSKPFEGSPRDEVKPNGGIEYGGAWSKFNASRFAKDVECSSDRAEAVVKSAESYFAWRRANEKPDDSEVGRVFSAVKNDPRQLFACSSEVDRALQDSCQAGDEAKMFRSLVVGMVQTEKQRRGLIETLGAMAGQLTLAQKHYVGYGAGIFVVAAVTAMCGVTLWQVITLMGGSLLTVLWMASFAAAGSFVVMVAIVSAHRHAGSNAVKSYVETCRELDALSVRRHGEARRILCEAVASRLQSRRRNARLKVHDLLTRIRDVLVRELQYRPAISAQNIARCEKKLSDFERKQRTDYLSHTRSELAVPAVRTSDVEKILLDQWSVGEKSFLAVWKSFCTTYDEENAGHLPVSVAIPLIRRYMSAFVQRARNLVRIEIDEADSAKKKKAIKEWIASSRRELLYSGKAPAKSKARDLKRQVFIAKDRQTGFFNDVRAAGDLTVSTEFFESFSLMCSEGAPMAFAFHEVPVVLDSDAATSVLKLNKSVEEEAR